MTKFVISPHIKGLIFDCDGTIADTMPLHFQCALEALGKDARFFSEEMFYEQAGVPAVGVMRLLKERCDLNFDPEKVAEEKERLFGEALHHVASVEAVEQVIRDYHGKLPMAVASGGTRENIERTLETLDLTPLFDAVVTADEVPNGKPAPDIFLEAARRINIAPGDCLVFEDGDKGIEAAQAAGMAWVDVRESAG